MPAPRVLEKQVVNHANGVGGNLIFELFHFLGQTPTLHSYQGIKSWPFGLPVESSDPVDSLFMDDFSVFIVEGLPLFHAHGAELSRV